MEDLSERAVQIARARFPGRPEVARAVSLRFQTGDVPAHVLAGHLTAGPKAADALVSPEVRQDMHLAAFIDRVAQTLPAVAPPKAPARQDQELKRVELVKRHSACWQTIERDLQDAIENGLRDAAWTGRKGWWREGDALDWARVRGKLIDPTAPRSSVFSMGRKKG